MLAHHEEAFFRGIYGREAPASLYQSSFLVSQRMGHGRDVTAAFVRLLSQRNRLELRQSSFPTTNAMMTTSDALSISRSSSTCAQTVTTSLSPCKACVSARVAALTVYGDILKVASMASKEIIWSIPH